MAPAENLVGTSTGVGLLQGGLVPRLAAAWLGPVNVRRSAMRFPAHVWPGEALILSGRFVSDPPAPGGVAVEPEPTAAGEVGQLEIAGWATAVIPTAPPERASSPSAMAPGVTVTVPAGTRKDQARRSDRREVSWISS